MNAWTRQAVLAALAQQLTRDLDQQIVDPAHPHFGALIHPDLGMPTPTEAAPFVTACAYLYIARHKGIPAPEGPPPATLLQRAHSAIDYLLQAQRPSGLIDLITCNFDSAPDTGFALQHLCTILELGRSLPSPDPQWAALLSKLETFIRRAVPGMCRGGFHTPNHRWVIASALAQAGALWPDLEVGKTIDRYLAEGFDLDGEGAFIEHSIGVYDAACDRSLLFLDEFRQCRAARKAAFANLDFNLFMLHADGTAETGLSRRHDHNVHLVPLALAAPYLHYAQIEDQPTFARAAHLLWQQATAPSRTDLLWLSYVLLKFDIARVEADTAPPLPDRYRRHFPQNGIWRVRRGPCSATAFRGRADLFRVRFGQAALERIQISQSYFGRGQFVADTLQVEGDTAILHSTGQADPRRPGYDQPLGHPVPPEQWAARADERPFRPLPPCASTLTIRALPDGFACRYRTLQGMDGVPAQLAFDLAPGGVWETPELCLTPQAGQVLFLKQGYGEMRYGNNAIRIGPGAHAHRMWHMRDAAQAPGCVRVLLTFLTPVDHAFTIHLGRQTH